MVKEQITSQMVESGKKLLADLDNTELDIYSSFWFYLEDPEKWRLFIASPQVNEEGPKKVYKIIQQVLSSVDENDINIQLKDISVVEYDHSLVKLLSIAIGNVKGDSEVRFSRNAINGHYIEDALIYRLNDK